MAGSSASSVLPSLEQIQKFVKSEYSNEAKRAANLRLLRALAVFATGVFVSRTWGEALFVTS